MTAPGRNPQTCAVTEVAYRDGTVVPHLRVAVTRDGEAVGFAQLHLHRTADGHVSFGFTGSVEREHREPINDD